MCGASGGEIGMMAVVMVIVVHSHRDNIIHPNCHATTGMQSLDTAFEYMERFWQVQKGRHKFG